MTAVSDLYDQNPSDDWAHLTRADVIDGQLFWERTLKAMARQMVGKDVLCLASGGGQQSVVFGLLGANVSVVDLSQVQLDQDEAIAESMGYPIRCHRQSMEDLSILEEVSFDLVYHAISICFCRDPAQVYRQVARVLKPHGLYRVEHVNPQSHDIEPETWTGDGYLVNEECFAAPDTGDMEFTFSFAQIFNALIDAGFEIVEVADDPDNLLPANEAEPGTIDHLERFCSTSFSVLARRL